MTWSLPDPMLTVPVDSLALPGGWAAEPKWDGYRAQLALHADRRVLLRSRQGTDMNRRVPRDPGSGPRAAAAGHRAGRGYVTCGGGCLSPKVSQAAQLP